MSDKKYVVLLALLGDPNVVVGIPETGGFNKTVSELLNILNNTDINIVVITNKNKYNSNNSTFSDNISIYRIDFENIWHSNQNKLVDNLDLIIQRVNSILCTLKKEAEVSLIHSFYWLSGYVASKIVDIPFIHTVISLSEDKYAAGVKPHADLQRSLEQEFLPKAKKIFAITPQEKRTLIGKYNIDENMIQVVGRSINQCFQNTYLNTQEIQILDEQTLEFNLSEDYSWWTSSAFLYVGRIVEIKGVKQIVSAWVMAKKKYNINVPLWIVGGTPLQIHKMRQLILSDLSCIEKYEKENQLIWWGNLNSISICTLMRKSQALIMHSSFEAGGRVIVEAFCAGIPVIATPYGFASDYIYDRYNGFLTGFNDIEKLAKIMNLFSEQPYLSSVMGTNAYNFINNVINKWNYERNHLDIYDSFINKTPVLSSSDLDIIPDDLNSFKRRNNVTTFPYFSTDLNISTLSKSINQRIGEHNIVPTSNDQFHSDFFLVSNNEKEYYLRHFYHILANKLSKLQYKNKDVISAKIQVNKFIASSKFNNIVNISYGDPLYLLCLIPKYDCILESPIMDILVSLWKELKPEKHMEKLWKNKDFEQLKHIIDNSDNPMINYLFCAELAYNELFINYKLPDNIDYKINLLMSKNRDAVFGLNYGKGIQGHVVSNEFGNKLLPTHSMFIGELGFDVVLTFLQYGKDDLLLWTKVKFSQTYVCSNSLDLWFLIIVYALGAENSYINIINGILDF